MGSAAEDFCSSNENTPRQIVGKVDTYSEQDSEDEQKGKISVKFSLEIFQDLLLQHSASGIVKVFIHTPCPGFFGLEAIILY